MILKSRMTTTAGSHPGYGQALAIGAIIVLVGWLVSLVGGCGTNVFSASRANVAEKCWFWDSLDLELTLDVMQASADEGIPRLAWLLEINDSTVCTQIILVKTMQGCGFSNDELPTCTPGYEIDAAIDTCVKCDLAMIDHVYGP